MAIPTCSAEATGYCHWGASMVSFGSEWIYLEFRMAFLKKFSKKYLSRRRSCSSFGDVAQFRSATSGDLHSRVISYPSLC
jgi:hypothetical protein